MARIRNRKARNAAEASATSQSETKTPTALKPEPKIVKKPLNQNLDKSKESKALPEVKEKPEKTSDEDRKKGKDAGDKENGNAQTKDQRNQNNKEKLGGLIFMCNRNTKPDVFRYMVMGLPEGKQELVTSIKPGLKLFLYDFDVKLLYGVYKASSSGGMKLEPSAFKGSYPAQVRFKVHMDCIPLTDDVFKKAIKENYDTKRNFFKMELTVQQVKKLVELFRPAPQLQSNVLTAAPTLYPVQLQVPLAPSQPMIATVDAPVRQYAPDDSRRYYLPAHKDIAPTQRGTVPHDPLLLSEKEYRTYGLKPPGPASLPTPAAPALDTSSGPRNPYNPYGAVLDRYSLASRRASYLSELEYQPDPSRRRVEGAEYNLRPVAEQSSTQVTYPQLHSYGIPTRNDIEYGGRVDEARRLHSAHAAIAPSGHNQRYQLPGSRADPESLPISSRYSFGGPSFPYL